MDVTQYDKVGMVLEGGGMRGIYTVGVLDILAEHDYLPHYIVGVSAGACNGISYASQQKGRGYRVIMDNIEDKRYVGWGNFFKTKSIFGMDFIFDEIPHKLDLFDYDTLANSPIEFVTGVTEVESGSSVFFSKEELNGSSVVLRASSSIPIFAPMVAYKGKNYLDGATSCPIPIKQALSDGCSKLIIILTQHRGYEKQAEKFRGIYKRVLRKYPQMIHTMDIRHEIYNQQLKEAFTLEAQGKAIIVAPSVPIDISRFEKRKSELQKIYELGRKNAQEKLSEILTLKSK